MIDVKMSSVRSCGYIACQTLVLDDGEQNTWRWSMPKTSYSFITNGSCIYSSRDLTENAFLSSAALIKIVSHFIVLRAGYLIFLINFVSVYIVVL